MLATKHNALQQPGSAIPLDNDDKCIHKNLSPPANPLNWSSASLLVKDPAKQMSL